MAKCAFFSLPVSFLRKYTKILLTLLIVILCCSAGTLVDAPLTYAKTPTAIVNIPIVVQFVSLGSARSATVLFSRQKQLSKCITTGNSTISGSIPEKGVVSVEFFSS